VYSIEEARKNTTEANVKPDLTDVLKKIIDKIDSRIEKNSKAGLNYAWIVYSDFEKCVEEEFPNLISDNFKYAMETLITLVKDEYLNNGYDIELSPGIEKITYDPLTAYRTSITIRW